MYLSRSKREEEEERRGHKCKYKGIGGVNSLKQEKGLLFRFSFSLCFLIWASFLLSVLLAFLLAFSLCFTASISISIQILTFFCFLSLGPPSNLHIRLSPSASASASAFAFRHGYPTTGTPPLPYKTPSGHHRSRHLGPLSSLSARLLRLTQRPTFRALHPGSLFADRRPHSHLVVGRLPRGARSHMDPRHPRQPRVRDRGSDRILRSSFFFFFFFFFIIIII